MKRFVDVDFEKRFGIRIDVKNQDYIRKRYSTHVCIIGAHGFIGRSIAAHFPGAVLVTRANRDEAFVREYELIINCAAVGGCRLHADDESVYHENMKTFMDVYTKAQFQHMIWFSSGAAEHDTPYGRSKRDIEALVHEDTRVHVLKIWGCFGPGEPEYRLLATAKRKGHVIIQQDRLFDYVHVNRVIGVIFGLIEHGGPRLIHMVYPKKYLLSEIVHMSGYPCSIVSNELAPPYIGNVNVDFGGSLEEDLKM